MSSCTFEGNVIGIRKREWGAVSPNLIALIHCQIYCSRRWGVDLGDGDGMRLLDRELSVIGNWGNPTSGAAILRATLAKGSGSGSGSGTGMGIAMGMAGFDGCWCESNWEQGLMVEDAPMLALIIRDSMFYASQSHRSIAIGRVRPANLEGVRAPPLGDIVSIEAVISMVRGGLIYTMEHRLFI